MMRLPPLAAAALAALLLCAAPALKAQVNTLIITDEGQYQEAADFTNTFEIRLSRPGGAAAQNSAKCQAVRVDREWFLTAAHCVAQMCKESCDIDIRLVVQPGYEMRRRVAHTTQAQRVFKARPDAGVASSAYDVALIYAPVRGAQYGYFIPSRGDAQISEELFLKIIPDFNVYYKAENGANIPDILHISSGTPVRIRREASVVSIWDGLRSVLPSKQQLIYMPGQKYIFGRNFGIRQGISGSGVMANTGELLGIVSATAVLEAKNPEDGQSLREQLVFIVPFDDVIIDFIRRTAQISNIKTPPKGIFARVAKKDLFLIEALTKAHKMPMK